MFEGSCLCGGVQYQLEAPISELALCHCQQCRKAQGSAFAANTAVPKSAFKLLAGVDLITEFQSSALKVRAFCQRCGSPLYSKRSDKPEWIRLRVGSLDTALDIAPSYCFYYADRAKWTPKLDGAIPKFDGPVPT